MSLFETVNRSFEMRFEQITFVHGISSLYVHVPHGHVLRVLHAHAPCVNVRVRVGNCCDHGICHAHARVHDVHGDRDDDPYVLHAMHRTSYHTLPWFQSDFRSYCIHRNRMVHIGRFHDCDTNAE